MTDVRFAFYGDDFTGSTDAIDALARNGVSAGLVLDPSRIDDLGSAFDDVQAVGIAGASRSMTPAGMDDALPQAFEALDGLETDIVHYKVCSTFDSAPDVGSIGHAIDIAVPIFDSPFVPLSVAAPPLERYVVFGNLFAGDGSDQVYRIDRHPTMSTHPVTPMTESDLRRHLGEQTDRPMSLLDVRGLDGPPETVDAAYEAARSETEDGGVLVFDGLSDDHLGSIGRLLWERCRPATDEDETLFVVGSSGVEYALADYWNAAGVIDDPVTYQPPDSAERIVVVSGSASPVTKRQIEWATENGFDGVRLDTERLLDPDTADDEIDDAITTARDVLEAGESPLLYSALGPDDPALDATRDRASELGIDADAVGRRLGESQGRILRGVLADTDVDRVCVAGGDTCSHVAPTLDLYALTMESPISPGAPLCHGHATDTMTDGVEIALKGGQLGSVDYFGRIRDGRVETA